LVLVKILNFSPYNICDKTSEFDDGAELIFPKEELKKLFFIDF